MFFPVPNVDSAVLNIKIRDKYHPKCVKTFLRTVKCAFAMRRKTLSNNLISSFKLTRDQIDVMLGKLGLQNTIRGERLNTDEFVKLSDEIYDIMQENKEVK